MSVNEVVVLSGKGGTGKTSLTASLMPWLESVVLADCDVDAPDLDILFEPNTCSKEIFKGAWKARIDHQKCIRCGICQEHCKFNAFSEDLEINPMHCEGCGLCTLVCPESAITMEETAVGEIYHSETRYGHMVHGSLFPGEETSGKLVSMVRKQAVIKAKEEGAALVLIDGSPGIGCNVISSLTGASLVLLVTEPSLSAMEDLKRLVSLVQNFSLPAVAVINKWDLSPGLTEKIEKWCLERDIPVLMKIPFSEKIARSITEKQIPSLALPDEYRQWGLENLLHRISRSD